MNQQRARLRDEPAQGEQVKEESRIDDQHLLRRAGSGRGFGDLPDADLGELAAQALVRIQFPETAWRGADDERRGGRGWRYLHLRLADQSTIGWVQSCALIERVSSIGGAGTAELPNMPDSRSHLSFKTDQWRRKMAAKAALDDEVLPCM